MQSVANSCAESQTQSQTTLDASHVERGDEALDTPADLHDDLFDHTFQLLRSSSIANLELQFVVSNMIGPHAATNERRIGALERLVCSQGGQVMPVLRDRSTPPVDGSQVHSSWMHPRAWMLAKDFVVGAPAADAPDGGAEPPPRPPR